MAEIYFCPTCSEQINMSFAVCPQCGTDVSAITKVKSKSASKKIEEKEEVEEEEVEVEEEENEEEEEVPVKKSVVKESVAPTKSGSRIGRWLYGILTTAIISGAIWLYNNYKSNPEMNNIISEITDKGKEIYSEQTSSENKEVYSDKLTDAVNNESAGSVKLEDFIGEWTNVDEQYSGINKPDENNLIINKNKAGVMFVVFKGHEASSANYTYKWGNINGNKVSCISTSKKDPSDKGAIELELSADKNLMTFSILDEISMTASITRELKRVK